MEMTATLALAGGAAWASGINLYAALLVFGIMGSTGAMALPPDLEILEHPLVIAAAGLMYCIEFVADKTPGVDSAWDVLHTFIRVPAGAVLAAAAVGDVEPSLQLAAFLIGGGLAAGSHVAKSGARAAINTSPEPFTNWTASIGEDLLVIAGLWTALNHPLIFLVLLGLFVVLLAWLLPKLFRALKSILSRLRSFGAGHAPDIAAAVPDSPVALEDRREAKRAD